MSRSVSIDDLSPELRSRALELAAAGSGSRRDRALTEKEIEHEGDRVMQRHGFEVIRFSQPRATKQTPGIADRLYVHRRRGVAIWWEAKTEDGAQTANQEAFQSLVESAGWVYVLGTTAELESYVRAKGYDRAEQDARHTHTTEDVR